MAESSIVGRDREVEQLREAVAGAAAGHGSVWYLTGEPGIGKSRLAEEVARLSREHGMRTFWGRCWEAGGAPAFWPWVQVLRAVLRTAEADRVERYLGTLAQVLPELRASQPTPESANLGADQARFQLMDAVSNTLADAAQRLPITIILEDLHVADVSTVLLLEFLTGAIRNQPLLIVATFRESDLATAPAGAQLTRAAQRERRIALRRLTEDDVHAFVEATGEQADSSFVRALHETTDGQPLFLVEVARLWRAQGVHAGESRPAIPGSVRTAVQERLATVTPECLRLLRRGAIVGREFDTGLLDASFDEGSHDSARYAQEATDAAILIEIAPQRYRYVHFLIREIVYEGIENAERASAHARLARTLRARAEGEEGLPWSEIAHHLAAAHLDSQAAQAYRMAGTQALEQLAFDEAVKGHRQALWTLDRGGNAPPTERIEILLDLAHAQTRAGAVADGKQTCVEAARVARLEGDAHWLARAALEHGTALQYARVDTDLVQLLEEALEALPDHDHPLRARVMARLAAALQPAENPDEPMQLARDAIDMARRLEDPETLLDALRNGGSTMVDIGDYDERVLLDRETAWLAEELGNPVEALRGNLRSIMDYLALERFDDAHRAMRACERITEGLGHPAYAWRPLSMSALRALWEGRLDDAQRLIDEARRLGALGADPNARAVYTMHRVRLLQLRGDFDAQLPLLEELESQWADSHIGLTGRLLAGAEHARAGRTDLAISHFDGAAVRKLLRLGDHTLQLCVAKLCVVAEDRELAEVLHRRMLMTRDHLVTGGIIYMTLEGPTSWGLAWLARFLELDDEASEHFEHALDVTRRTRGRPAHALIAAEYASHLIDAGAPADLTRVRNLLELAATTADELGMTALRMEVSGLLERVGVEPSPSAEPQDEGAAVLTMTQVGDAWLVRYGNVDFHLKDVRGVRMLATLIAEPGRERHVLDLSGRPADPGEPVDRGDAGEVLDLEARRQYAARVQALRAEIEEAEAWNDPGRLELAQGELDVIERELSSAVGLGGRARRSGSAAERARVNVQRRIRDAIRRIESYHPALAKHLQRAVRTGTYCVYEP